MTALVELVGVTKTYGPVRALVGISWAFEAGSVTVVRGPNGSGKSTLLSILATITRPTSGRVRHALGTAREAVRRGLGWVGHDSLCYPDLTGRQNVELAAVLHGLEPGRAYAEASERFELAGFAERAVRSYSRGQRQRVALARALVHAPRLVLLDEPTSGLDASSWSRLLSVLEAERARGTTLIVVTHDAGFADALGASILELERGRVVTRGAS